jgi:hypothetical protein
MRIRIRDPGIFFTLDPGWKKFGGKFMERLNVSHLNCYDECADGF